MLEELSFEKVCELLWLQIEPLWTFPIDAHFHQGYRVGVVLTLLAVILLSVLWRIRRFFRRRCREVVLKGDNGGLTIVAAAITDAVELALTGIAGLSVNNCRMYRSGSKLRLEIRCRWEQSAGAALPQIDDARKRVAEMLRDTFGIQNVKRIDFRINGVITRGGQPVSVPPPVAPAAPPSI